MATAALAAGGSALSGLLSALGSQGSRRSEVTRPTMESALPVIAAADKKKLKKILKEADKERLYTLLMQPEVMGLMITLGGIYAANHIPFGSNPAETEALQSIAVTASVLLGLGYAGVGDLTTLIVALGAGGFSLLGGVGGPGGGFGSSGIPYNPFSPASAPLAILDYLGITK